MRNLPASSLYVVVPVVAIATAVAIGVGLGLLNLWSREMFDSAIAPVAVAGSITIIIMAVATVLSINSPKVDED